MNWAFWWAAGAVFVIAGASGAARASDCLEFVNVEPVTGAPYEGGEYAFASGNGGVTVTVHTFFTVNTQSGQLEELKGPAHMVNSSCFGGPAAMSLTNATLLFEIEQDRPDARKININYCERGPSENIGARFRAPPDLIADTPRAGGEIVPNANGGDVQLSVDFVQRPAGTDGKLIFAAPQHMTQIHYGGVELQVHSICVGS